MACEDELMEIVPVTLIYLHGFNSSPGSYKAQRLKQFIDNGHYHCHYIVPKLPFSPLETEKMLCSLIESRLSLGEVVLVGSSLGGYYATYLAEKYKLRAALVNPAVRPYELLNDYLGENVNIYTGERSCLTLNHMSELLALDIPLISLPERLFLLTQTCDETLNYREAMEKMKESPAWVQHGGNHEFQNFNNVIPAILSFLRIKKQC